MSCKSGELFKHGAWQMREYAMQKWLAVIACASAILPNNHFQILKKIGF